MKPLDFVRFHRPQFLLAGFALNLLGAAAVLHLGTSIDWVRFGLFQVVVSSCQLAGSSANEIADVRTDGLNDNRTWFSGGSGMVSSGRIAMRTARLTLAFWTGLALAASMMLAFAFEAGVVSLLMMILGLLLALSYSLRPLAFSYKGLGELAMAFMVSFLTPVTSFYVLYGDFEATIVLATVPLVFQLMGLMMVVEYPDRSADIAAEKRTLVVRLGASRSWVVGILMLALGGGWAFIGGAFGLTVTASLLCGGILLGEAAVFWMIGRTEESKSRIFWSTAISCGFYVLVIALMAATISA